MTTNNPTPTQPETLLPCPLYGHLPDKGEFTNGPYIAVSGAPNMPKFYAIVCPGCCSTAYDENKERVVKKWNTRAAVTAPRGDWQPIATVPKDGDEVLLAHANSQWLDQWISDVTGDYAEGGYWMMCDQWTEPETPSHWKPLSPLPAAATSSPTPAESVSAKCGGSGEIEIGCAMDHALTAPCVECRGTGTITTAPPERTQHEHRWVGRGEYGGTEIGYMCADCGVDMDDTDVENVAKCDEWLDSLTQTQLDNYSQRSLANEAWRRGAAESARVAGEQWRQGMKDAAKEVCDACDNEERYGPARKIEGSTRWWHGDDNIPCEAGGIWHVLAERTTNAAAPADNDAESLLQHVAYSGVEFDDNRIGYVVVQIDCDVWEQIQKLVRPTTKGAR